MEPFIIIFYLAQQYNFPESVLLVYDPIHPYYYLDDL